MKKKRFIVTITVYILITLVDLGLTYYNSPDLTMESNFLVRDLELGWGALLFAAIVSMLIFTAASYYDCFIYNTIYTGDKKLTNYISSLNYERADKFWSGGLPKHISSDMAALGFALPWGMSCCRFICVCEWLTVTFGVENTFPYSILRIDAITYIPSVILTVFLYFYWFYIEFKGI